MSVLAAVIALAAGVSSGQAPAPAQGQFVTFPGSPFQLYQPYPPAGDQPGAIESTALVGVQIDPRGHILQGFDLGAMRLQHIEQGTRR